VFSDEQDFATPMVSTFAKKNAEMTGDPARMR